MKERKLLPAEAALGCLLLDNCPGWFMRVLRTAMIEPSCSFY